MGKKMFQTTNQPFKFWAAHDPCPQPQIGIAGSELSAWAEKRRKGYNFTSVFDVFCTCCVWFQMLGSQQNNDDRGDSWRNAPHGLSPFCWSNQSHHHTGHSSLLVPRIVLAYILQTQIHTVCDCMTGLVEKRAIVHESDFNHPCPSHFQQCYGYMEVSYRGTPKSSIDRWSFPYKHW